MAIKKEELLDAIANMTVLEISELVKAMEEKFGVSAAAPTAVAVAPSGEASGAETEEKNSFDVYVKNVVNKIAVIKVVKTITGLGLKETKDLVEAEGEAIKKGVPKAEAEEMKKQIEEAGAVVELK